MSLYRYATVLAIQMEVVYRLVVFNIMHTLKYDAWLLRDIIIDTYVYLLRILMLLSLVRMYVCL